MDQYSNDEFIGIHPVSLCTCAFSVYRIGMLRIQLVDVWAEGYMKMMATEVRQHLVVTFDHHWIGRDDSFSWSTRLTHLSCLHSSAEVK
ncbi:hypothetical protein NPIL_501391 [Nephila pilipes]|uniref:Uncharacterized protein n=1 Tax=Nephila pilipes TaxID=299642 RepID=A0A8X6UD13_NEPPI|nr:hypothetical protein NPIL_501391 [Nephila pilipes]